MTDQSHPSPHRERVNFWVLLFADAVTPIFWSGQLLLGYIVVANGCGGMGSLEWSGDGASLRKTLIAFDAVAIMASLVGGLIAYLAWRKTHQEKDGGATNAINTGEGRSRFMALWGMLSSLWFLLAIVFNTIATLTVPLCIG